MMDLKHLKNVWKILWKLNHLSHVSVLRDILSINASCHV